MNHIQTTLALVALLGMPTAALADCPADQDSNGRVDGLDLGIVLGAWGSSGPMGDVDSSGLVDILDLLGVLNGWGDCPADAFVCGDFLVDTRDGQSYATVGIGLHCWMADNLNYGAFTASTRPGSVAADDGIAQRTCYDNDPANCALYGGLYEWDEVMNFAASSNSDPSGVQGICPDGWEVPSDAAYQDLERSLGMAPWEVDLLDDWRGAPVGARIKDGGGSGFDGLLSGWRDFETGTFNDIGFYGGLWTSRASTEDPTESYNRGLLAPWDTVGRYRYDARAGLGLRCVEVGLVND